ncbi:hypothetical protein GSI_00919 [Ganoderma sinense ZZ0214-1]|uniref:DNA replication checkpoint mediator MRC1 domain-containing protein n=1 Tax=Ganoderma sinense ZZ0214-1 TaxID=1077348 RepID=A0A2G8STW9_9APHY|nr:hypothetical protein GSI_00919 [Ganoderma sinense ZZ0214-1]
MSDSSSPVIKRSTRTYGKPRKTSTPDTSFDTSLELDFDPDSSTSSAYDIPPASDPADVSIESPHREDLYSDDDNDASQQSREHPASSHLHDWRAALRQIDAKFDEDALTAPTVLATPDETQRTHTSHATLSPDQDQPMPDASGSSPTPPTSIEAMPKKGKGKARATEPRQSNSDNEAAGSSRPSKSSKTGGKGKKAGGRIRAPTKKEREETQKTTARLVADQPVSLPRPDQPKQFTLSGLLSRVSVLKPETPRIPSSDPIQSSSPPTERLELNPGSPASSKEVTKDDFFVANGLLGDADSQSEDEDLPDALTLIKQKQAAAEESKRQQELRQAKLLLLEQQQHIVADDGESDLEIEDNHESVLREEGQARRAEYARGARPSKGRADQLAYASPNARRKTVQLPVDDAQMRRVFKASAASAFEPSSAKTAKQTKLSRQDLNKMLLQKADRDKQQIDRAKLEDWKRRGGRLKEHAEAVAPAKSPAELLQEIIQQRQAKSKVSEKVSDDDESDEEWKPEDNSHAVERSGEEDEGEGQPSPMLIDNEGQADDEDDDENPFLVPRMRRLGGHTRTRVVATQSDDEDDAENRPPIPSSLGSILAQESQIPFECTQPPDSAPPSFSHRYSISSIGDNTDGSRTEDGTDKENDVRLSFDRGEDKENTKVHSPVSAVSLRLGHSFGALFADDTQPLASPSGSVRRGAPGDVRSPLKELPKDDDDDPFGFMPGPPLRLGGMSGMASLEASPIPVNLGEGSGLGLEPAFSLKGKERARDGSPLADALDLGGGGFGGGGFSQFATQAGNARGFDQLKAADDDIDLTPEPGPQAALDVSNTFRKKADEIFEKEQVALAEQGMASTSEEAPPEMFVDANGFLTQTRPTTDESPMRFRSPIKTQVTPGWQFSTTVSAKGVFSSLRKPLAPILSQDPDEDDVPARKRLHKRAVSASPERAPGPAPKLRSAFDVLGKRTSPKQKRPIRSDFVEGEAEESDDEAAFGFGARKPDDDEEEDGEDQDRHLEDLVDDKEMDEKTLAEAAVLEKVREHQEEDDRKNEKVHVDAIKGVYRVRRRDRGLGFEDDDSDDEEVRRPRPKRARVENDTIAALARNKDTQAFANEYHAHTSEDENEFAHLNNDAMELDFAQPEEQPLEDEQPETVSADQLRQELRERAQQREEVEAFNPEDTSWIDRERAGGSDDEMEQQRVREVSNEAVPAHRQLADEPIQAMGSRLDGTNRARMAQWAKFETSSSRAAPLVGRNTGGSAAVTGHGLKPKRDGSFKAPRAAASSSESSGAVKPTKISKGASFLSTAVSNKWGKSAKAT